MKNYILLLLCGMLFASCNTKPSLKEYMADSWESTYLKIEMPTYQKSDSTSVFEDTFQNNPARIARSKYNEDGTFVAWYLNRAGK